MLLVFAERSIHLCHTWNEGGASTPQVKERGGGRKREEREQEPVHWQFRKGTFMDKPRQCTLLSSPSFTHRRGE